MFQDTRDHSSIYNRNHLVLSPHLYEHESMDYSFSTSYDSQSKGLHNLIFIYLYSCYLQNSIHTENSFKARKSLRVAVKSKTF